MSELRYRVNEPGVVYELFDDEVVVVNLDNGYYYSLEREAADIWRGLGAGLTVDELPTELARRYQGEAATMSLEVGKFVEQLVGEGLIAPTQEGSNRDGVESLLSADGTRTFMAPKLACFTDMQALLLLDPIHEVDASGWPHAKPEA